MMALMVEETTTLVWMSNLCFQRFSTIRILRTHGMNITIITTTNSDKEAYKLLELMGMPFAKK